MQYFWEVRLLRSYLHQLGNSLLYRTELYFIILQAFPAGSGPLDRTTYMFTYVDPQSRCPRLEDLLEDYWDLMPNYQVKLLDSLTVCKLLFVDLNSQNNKTVYLDQVYDKVDVVTVFVRLLYKIYHLIYCEESLQQSIDGFKDFLNISNTIFPFCLIP